jgi:hypothetical protein
MSEWQPIVTAPYEAEIWLRSEQGNIEKGRIEKTKFDEPLVWDSSLMEKPTHWKPM